MSENIKSSNNDNHVKILFRYHSDVLDEETVETMWATIVDEEKGRFKLDNIPFYGPPVASDDIVFAEYDEDEQMLTYRETVEYSGNSVVQVIILENDLDINSIRKQFEELKCSSEGMNQTYFVIEIPTSVDYTPIKNKLDAFEKSGILSYAEPCLSEIHKY